MYDFDRFDKAFGIDKSKKTPWNSSRKRNLRNTETSASKRKSRRKSDVNCNQFKLNLTVKKKGKEEIGTSRSLSPQTPVTSRDQLFNFSLSRLSSQPVSTQSRSPDKQAILPFMSCLLEDFKEDMKEKASSDEE